jgi:AcrR family transcriptional regulator
MVLRESLLELMETYDTASISVKELCGKADINRATFYANYKNIGELLHSIEEEVKAELTTIFERSWLERTKCEAVKMAKETLQYMVNHKSVMKVLLSHHSCPDFQKELFDTFHRKTITLMGSKKKPETRTARYYTAFAMAGAAGIIRYWMESDMDMPIDTIAGMLTDLTGYLHEFK